MGENPSEYKGADHPVENVSWDDCQAFLEKLNAHPAARASGLVFRLPTEEEWEYACRAGSTIDFCRLADGTEITAETLGRVAWFRANLSTRPRWLADFLAFAEGLVDRVYEVNWTETLAHKPVGRKEPNAWGLHDMHGNVWEWTETAEANGKRRVIRGGGWLSYDGNCESSINGRGEDAPSIRGNTLGFRLCASGRADTPDVADEPHAESAESAEPEGGEGSGEALPHLVENHAESAESAESESHAESAETAEPESHAESAEGQRP